MGLVGIAVAFGVAAGLLAGRRPRAGAVIPGSRTRRALAAAALVAGIACVLAGDLWRPAGVAGYALLTGLAVVEHRRIGMILMAAGLAANLTVIAVDHGMPVKGLPASAHAGALHHALAPGDRLVGLSDVIAVPALPGKVSAGDVVLSLGAAVAMFGWLEPRRPRRAVAAE